jgi:hypothetical protein
MRLQMACPAESVESKIEAAALGLVRGLAGAVGLAASSALKG